MTDTTLSKTLSTKEKVTLIIDDRKNRERIAVKFIESLLRETGEDPDTIKIMPTGSELKHAATFDALLNECSDNNNSQIEQNSQIELNSQTTDKSTIANDTCNSPKAPIYNIILPTLSDLLCYQSPAFIFDFLKKLRYSMQVRRAFIWATPHNLLHPHADFIISACEYMAKLVIRLETENQILTTIRRRNATVCIKRYACQVDKTQFTLTPLDGNKSNSPDKTTVKSQPPEPVGGTFKIELEESEIVARNALILPYEHSNDDSEMADIYYTVDGNDDFDNEDPDEDPDEDLNV